MRLNILIIITSIVSIIQACDENCFSAYQIRKIILTNDTCEPVSFELLAKFCCNIPKGKRRICPDDGFLFHANNQTFVEINATNNSPFTKFVTLLQGANLKLLPNEKRSFTVSGHISDLRKSADQTLPPYSWDILNGCIVIHFLASQHERNLLQLTKTPQDVWGRVKCFSTIFPNLTEITASNLCQNLIQRIRFSHRENFIELNHIPHRHTRVWVTDTRTPHEPPIDRLDCFIESCRILNEIHEDWEHHFWCFNIEQLPQTKTHLTKANVGIQFHSLSEILPTMKARHIFEALVQNSLYTIASDLARQEIVRQMGGLYADMGIKIHSELARAINCCEYMWWLTAGRFEFCLMGAKAHDPFFEHHMDFLDTLWQKSSEPRFTKLFPPKWNMHWTGSGFLGADFMNYCLKQKTLPITFFVPNGRLAKNKHLRSWGDNGAPTLFGNKSIKENPFSYFLPCPLGRENEHQEWMSIGTAHLNMWHPEIGEVLFGISKENAIKTREKIFEESRKIFFTQPRSQIKAIPLITHRMWLTKNSSEVPEEQLNQYIVSCRLLNESNANWRHILWCLDPSLIPVTVQSLIEANIGIEIRCMSELYSTMKAKHVFDAVLEDGLITKAGNIGRLAAINEMGGLYFDIGIRINRSMVELIDCYEAIWWLWPQSSHNAMDLCIVGAPPKSPVIEGFFNVIDRLWEVPHSHPKLAQVNRFDWVSAPFVHACLSQYGRDIKTLFVTDGSFAESHRLRSWGQYEQPTKFGLKSVSESTLDIFAIRPNDISNEEKYGKWLLELAQI